MAAGVLLRRGTAPVTATLLASTILLYPRVAHAEAAPEHQFARRKPIYDEFENTATYASTSAKPTSSAAAITFNPSNEDALTQLQRPTITDQLAAEIRDVRLFLYRHSCAAEDRINSLLAQAFSLEQDITATVASLAPPRSSGERLMPGAVYVLVASMAGSIIARNRGFILRATTPLALGVGAAWIVLPVTMGNVSALLWRYEQRLPAVVEVHQAVHENVEKGVSFARVHARLGVRKVEETVADWREVVEGWVRKGK